MPYHYCLVLASRNLEYIEGMWAGWGGLSPGKST